MPIGFGGAFLPQRYGTLADAAAYGGTTAPPSMGAPASPFAPPATHGRPKFKADSRALADALRNLLASQGHTDPARLNLELTGIGRSTEAQQLALRDQLAQQGLGSSGLGAALSAAIGASGGEQMAGARARENALAEARKREDIQKVMDYILAIKQLRFQRRQLKTERKLGKAQLRQQRKELGHQIGKSIASSVGAGMG